MQRFLMHRNSLPYKIIKAVWRFVTNTFRISARLVEQSIERSRGYAGRANS
jgi:hypothetical protein